MCANRVLQVGCALFLAAALGLFPGARTSSAQATGTVAGRVVTQADLPAADAQVRLVNLGRAARVAEDGRFRFDDVPAGSYLLEATSERHGRALERISVAAGEELELELRLSLVFHAEEIVVSVGPRAVRQSEAYQATSVISGSELRALAEPSLGETLARLPGVNSTYFGPGASRPVIRGLGGDRIRILERGVGVGDASATSPDHPVSVEPVALQRIEVIRGPATLLYGSSAIGGVVNVIDGRIPTELPTRPVTGRIVGLGGTVADERNGSLELGGALGRVAWHLSALGRKTNDYRIPRGALGERAEEEGPDLEEEDPGVLENSFVETLRGAVGVSYLAANGYLGVSWAGHDTKFGIPGGGHGDEEEEEEEELATIDAQQRRVDAEGSWRLASPYLERVKARFGYANYRHFELEDGEIETVFENDEWEGRLELQHSLGAAVGGTLGAQIRRRDFSAVGEEAFVPPTDTDAFALFLFEEFGRGPVRFQAGGRFDHQRLTNTAAGIRRTEDGLSASLGVNWTPAEALVLALSASRSVKLPSAEELFSNGPHLATRAFEVGDPDLEQEVGYSVDAALRLVEGPAGGSFTVFVNRFNDFIFQTFTGEEEDGLPVLLYTQGDALFSGFEAEAEVDLFHHGEHGHHLVLSAWGDYVRATLTAPDEPLPRIPPLRFGSRLRYEAGPWHGEAGVRRVTAQERIAALEEPTPGHTMLDASLGYRFFTSGLTHEVRLRGTNLTDQVARNHTSFLKEVAPLPGRELRLTYALSF